MHQALTKTESAVANTILDWFHDQGVLITHMKIQKLFYFAFGYHLAKYDQNMIEHYFEAWPYGPVLPELYEVLKSYGDTPITRLINNQEDNRPYLYKEGPVFETVFTTLKSFSGYTAWKLSEITHDNQGPWFQTVREKSYWQKIENDLIKEFFKKKMSYFE